MDFDEKINLSVNGKVGDKVNMNLNYNTDATFDFDSQNMKLKYEADYEENRHFFLSQYFRDKYDAAMQKLPNITTGITINRVEIWVTNKTGTTSNSRNIVALTDLGENTKVSNSMWGLTGQNVPGNNANSEYSTMVNSYAAARDINQTSGIHLAEVDAAD